MHRLRPGDRRGRRAPLTDPQEIVRIGYDAIAERYAEWSSVDWPTRAWVAKLIDLLPKRSDVLEIGCGNGEPAARLLAAGNDYTGIDVSAAQLERARAHVPDATFLQADYTVFEPSALVDAVVAILTTTHVPRTEHPELLHRIARWLRRGGLLLATFGSGDLPDRYEDDWLGAPMFFSHYDAETNLRLLEEAGFDLVEHEIVPMIEEGHGEVRFLWVLARRA